MLSFLRLRFASSLFAIRETLQRRLDRVQATLAHLSQDTEEADELTLSAALEEGEDDTEAVQSLLRDRTSADLAWEAGRLKTLLGELRDLSGPSSKLERLLQHLESRWLPSGHLQQTVIFTRFYDTLTDIIERLRRVDPQMLVGMYSGKGGSYWNPKTRRLTGAAREEIKRRFLREEIDVLVCTDAAGGLNLQTADLLINFDLP